MPHFSQLLDAIPVTLVFGVFMTSALIISEVGFRIGRWWQRRFAGEQKGPTEMLVGSILTMLSFLLAVTVGMASDRADARRSLVREEANTIRTTFLRAGYLAEPYAEDFRNLLREYVTVRIPTPDVTRIAANNARSKAIHGELWTRSKELVQLTPDTETSALFIDSVNQVIEVHTSRVAAGISRVPEPLIVVLMVGALLTLGVMGYSAGLTAQRGLLSAVVLMVALGAILTLVIDLDRPLDGFVRVSQQPLLDLREDLAAPPTLPGRQ